MFSLTHLTLHNDMIVECCLKDLLEIARSIIM